MAFIAILFIATCGLYYAVRDTSGHCPVQEEMLLPSAAIPAELSNKSYRINAATHLEEHIFSGTRDKHQGILLMSKILEYMVEDSRYVIWNIARIGGPEHADRHLRKDVHFGALVFATREKDLAARDRASNDRQFLTGDGKEMNRVFSDRTVSWSFNWWRGQDRNWAWMEWLVGSAHPQWPGKIVGYMLTQLHPSWMKNLTDWNDQYPHSWKLDYIETSKNHRGRGLARAMMAGVLDSLEQLNIPPEGLASIEAYGQIASSTNAPTFWGLLLEKLESDGKVKTNPLNSMVKFVRMHDVKADQMEKPEFERIYTAWQRASWQNALFGGMSKLSSFELR